MYKELLLFIFLVAPLSGQTFYARAISNGRCVLPPQPAHGRYSSNILNGRPGTTHDYLVVNVTCIPGYSPDGPDSSYCYDGEWVKPVPACVRPTDDRQGQGSADKSKTKCILPQHPPNGKFTSNIPRGKPGVAYDYLVVNVTCDRGYERTGTTLVHCYEGTWSGTPPTCISSGPVKEPQPLGITVPPVTASRVTAPFVNTPPTVRPTSRLPVNKDKTSSANSCVLPEFPVNGYYVTNQGSSGPGDALEIVAVTYSCRAGYILTGPALVYCYQNKWSAPIPQCVARCRVPVHPSVEYRCLVPQRSDGESYSSGFSYRPCNEFEPSGTRVKPVCKRHYYSTIGLKLMHCEDGEWSSIKTCIPECGTLTPIGSQLVLNGTLAKHGEIPWHVAIYRTTSDPYSLICGGSLISSDIVLSAAHCFWDKFLEVLSSSSNYMIAAGKLYRGPNNPADQPQWSTVESIHVPKTYFGVKTRFQDDIAVVRLASPVRYQSHIRPVCLHFDAAFDNRQLRPDNKGKVAGWGLMSEDIVDGGYSRELRVVELPFVPVDKCYNAVPETFQVFLTGDKFCAGYLDAKTAVCEGDSGGGLAFPEDDRGVRRYYLRGIVSTAPTNDHDCNGDTYTTFTRVVNHENFISQYWRD